MIWSIVIAITISAISAVLMLVVLRIRTASGSYARLVYRIDRDLLIVDITEPDENTMRKILTLLEVIQPESEPPRPTVVRRRRQPL